MTSAWPGWTRWRGTRAATCGSRPTTCPVTSAEPWTLQVQAVLTYTCGRCSSTSRPIFRLTETKIGRLMPLLGNCLHFMLSLGDCLPRLMLLLGDCLMLLLCDCLHLMLLLGYCLRCLMLSLGDGLHLMLLLGDCLRLMISLVTVLVFNAIFGWLFYIWCYCWVTVYVTWCYH